MLKDYITYFEGKYIIKYEDRWTSRESHLNPALVSSHITYEDYCNIGFFNSYKSKFFAIDIDAHDGNNHILSWAYKELFTKFAEPTFVCKSPNGFHAYYLLSDYYSSQLIISSVQSKLKKFTYRTRFEVRPTTSTGLRAPNLNYILDPVSMKYIPAFSEGDFCRYLEDRPHYHPEEFISINIGNTKTVKIPSAVICKGTTNEALNYYVPLWRSKGLNEEQIANKFIESLEPGYKGECTRYNRVLKRVESYFKNFEPSAFTPKVNTTELESKYKQLIKYIVEIYENRNSHNEKLRRASIKEDLIKILMFRDHSYEIYENKETKYVHGEKNPYFLYEMSQDCIPIASSSVKVKNIKFFKDIGLLSLPHGRHYDTKKHSCIHYKINIDMFISMYQDNTNDSNNNLNTPINHTNNLCFNLFEYQSGQQTALVATEIDIEPLFEGDPPRKKKTMIYTPPKVKLFNKNLIPASKQWQNSEVYEMYSGLDARWKRTENCINRIFNGKYNNNNKVY